MLNIGRPVMRGKEEIEQAHERHAHASDQVHVCVRHRVYQVARLAGGVQPVERPGQYLVHALDGAEEKAGRCLPAKNLASRNSSSWRPFRARPFAILRTRPTVM